VPAHFAIGDDGLVPACDDCRPYIDNAAPKFADDDTVGIQIKRDDDSDATGDDDAPSVIAFPVAPDADAVDDDASTDDSDNDSEDAGEPIPTSGLILAIENAWDQIAGMYPQVPDARIVLAPAKKQHIGEYTPDAWVPVGEGDKFAEVYVDSRSVVDGGEGLFHALLHTAAHAIAAERAVQVTSRQGRYHNNEFATIAHELELGAESIKGKGQVTSLTPNTRDMWDATIGDLDAAISHYWEDPAAADGGKVKAERAPRRWMTCGCDPVRKIGYPRDGKPIVCGLCSDTFVELVQS
jgi:hypothetical protein